MLRRGPDPNISDPYTLDAQTTVAGLAQAEGFDLDFNLAPWSTAGLDHRLTPLLR